LGFLVTRLNSLIRALERILKSEATNILSTNVNLPVEGKQAYFWKSSFAFPSTLSRPALGPTQPPVQWVPGALSPGVKWLGYEADHSLPSSAEVKKMWIHTSTPPYTFMAVLN
jgi:hypothetical protein